MCDGIEESKILNIRDIGLIIDKLVYCNRFASIKMDVVSYLKPNSLFIEEIFFFELDLAYIDIISKKIEIEVVEVVPLASLRRLRHSLVADLLIIENCDLFHIVLRDQDE